MIKKLLQPILELFRKKPVDNFYSPTESVRKHDIQAPGTIPIAQAMQLPRAARRALGKMNGGIKIPGTTKPYIRAIHGSYEDYQKGNIIRP